MSKVMVDCGEDTDSTDNKSSKNSNLNISKKKKAQGNTINLSHLDEEDD